MLGDASSYHVYFIATTNDQGHSLAQFDPWHVVVVDAFHILPSGKFENIRTHGMIGEIVDLKIVHLTYCPTSIHTVITIYIDDDQQPKTAFPKSATDDSRSSDPVIPLPSSLQSKKSSNKTEDGGG